MNFVFSFEIDELNFIFYFFLGFSPVEKFPQAKFAPYKNISYEWNPPVSHAMHIYGQDPYIRVLETWHSVPILQEYWLYLLIFNFD